LFLGTPAGSKWARQWRLDPKKTDPDGEVAEVASYAEWLALPAADRARRRYVLLSHHEDPVTRFEPALIVQQPGWLGPGRQPPARHIAPGVLVPADHLRPHPGGREERDERHPWQVRRPRPRLPRRPRPHDQRDIPPARRKRRVARHRAHPAAPRGQMGPAAPRRRATAPGQRGCPAPDQKLGLTGDTTTASSGRPDEHPAPASSQTCT
jgi:hypothetical protein